MKKLLALVLALVMVLSLCVTSNAADFTDAKELTYTEAIDVMKTIKVIDGFTDGSFQGKGLLTRAQAAKIICNLVLGPTTADALVANNAPFADVPATHWAAGFIAYCASEGIINGVGAGKFDPDGQLTGYAFMKMLLGALGYDAKTEGYVGDNWSIQVAKRALNIGLDDDLEGSFNGNNAVTREEACLFALNALKSDMVYYDETSTITVPTAAGDVVFSNSSKAQVESNSISRTDGKVYAPDGVMQFAEKYFADLKVISTTDDFGRDANKYTYKKDSVGTYAKTADETYTGKVKKGDLYDLIGKDVYDDLKDATDTAACLTYVVDGYAVSTYAPSAATMGCFFSKNSTGAVGDGNPGTTTGNSVQTEVYVYSKTHAVKVVMINTYVAQATADYSTKKESLTVKPLGTAAGLTFDSTVLKAEDFDVADYKEDDYLTFTCTRNSSGKYEIQSIAPATVVSGNVDGYSAGDNVTIDGTKYSYNKAIAADATNGKDATYQVGKNAKVVLDSFGNIVYVKDKTAASDKWVYVEEIATASGLGNKYIASAIFPDGTEADITLKSLDNNNLTAGDVGMKGQWYTYTMSGEKYKLETSSALAGKLTTPNNGDYAFENGKTALANQTPATYKVNADTTFIVKDADDDVTVYEGIAKAPTVKAKSSNKATVAFVKNSSNNFAKYVFVDTDNATVEDGNTADMKFVYILKLDSTNITVDNDKYYTYKALVDGEETLINVDDECSGITLGTDGKSAVGQLFYRGKLNADEWYTSLTQVATAKKAIFSNKTTLTNAIVDYDAGVLTLGGAEKVLADDYQLIVVVNKGVTALLDDADASYEVNDMTASAFENLAAGYKLTGSYYTVKVDSDDDTIKSVYVFITGAVAIP